MSKLHAISLDFESCACVPDVKEIEKCDPPEAADGAWMVLRREIITQFCNATQLLLIAYETVPDDVVIHGTVQDHGQGSYGLQLFKPKSAAQPEWEKTNQRLTSFGFDLKDITLQSALDVRAEHDTILFSGWGMHEALEKIARKKSVNGPLFEGHMNFIHHMLERAPERYKEYVPARKLN